MRIASLALIASLGTAAAASNASAVEGPQQFMNRVLAYEAASNANMRSRSYLVFFTSRLRAAIRADMRGTEIGLLDYDPICQCQDDAGQTLRIIAVRTTGRASIATVESTSGGERSRITFRLANGREGWRIADIGTASRPSLLKSLEAEHRARR